MPLATDWFNQFRVTHFYLVGARNCGHAHRTGRYYHYVKVVMRLLEISHQYRQDAAF